MGPKFSRRGWFRGVGAALLAGGPGRRAARRRRTRAATPPFPVGAVTYESAPTTTFVYDAAAGLRCVEATGRVTTFAYDAAGRRCGEWGSPPSSTT